MVALIHDERIERELRAQRIASGSDRQDEVWEGVYVMAPMPNIEQQRLVGGLTHALSEVVPGQSLGEVFPGVNVSDRDDEWKDNFRVPDVAVFLNETLAVPREAFWFGGPDFAVEITSPNDQTRKKLGFYADVGSRELLIVDRHPWQLELFQPVDGSMQSVAKVAGDSAVIRSQVLPVDISLQSVEPRPSTSSRLRAFGRGRFEMLRCTKPIVDFSAYE